MTEELEVERGDVRDNGRRPPRAVGVVLAVCVCLHSSSLVIVAQQEILQESMTPIQPLMTILE